MARVKGLASFSANFEPQSAEPLDARAVVQTISDLTDPTVWSAHDGNVYLYKGIIVSVTDDVTPSNNGLYRLIDTDYTNIINWEKLGAGSGGSSVWGGITGDLTDQVDLKASLDSKKIYHGIESYGTITFNNATQILSLSSVTYWFKGTKVQETLLSADINAYFTLSVNTLYYIAFDDASGVLKVFSSMNLYNMCPVTMVFWNGSIGAVTREPHNHTRNIDWHVNAHRTIGTRYYTGLDLVKPVSGVSDNQIELTTGLLYDEDIPHTINNVDTINNIRAFYQVSPGVYSFSDFPDPILSLNNVNPRYLNTSSYTLSTYPNNRFSNFWVYGSADIDRPIYIVPTQRSVHFNSITDAREEAPPILLGPGVNSLTPEFKLLYKFTYRGDGLLVEISDYRRSSSLPSGQVGSIVASAVIFSASDRISSTNVQNAIEEVDSNAMVYALIFG